MAVGNLALVAVAALIGQRNAFSVLDGIFWLIVVALGAARYFDIRRFNGLTIEGDAATSVHLRRYTVRLPIVAGVLWALAHLLQGILT